MDIIPVFGTVVGGSNPSGCTSAMRAWFSGRTRPCQGRDSGSIPGARTIKLGISLWTLGIRDKKYGLNTSNCLTLSPFYFVGKYGEYSIHRTIR